MTLRIGFDMDGVLADFSGAFHDVEQRLFGPGDRAGAGEPEREEEAQEAAARNIAPVPSEEPETPRQSRRRRDTIWRDIQATENFWESLNPIDPQAVGRIYALMVRHHWEVFFITQRPKTAGDTVQRQTQRWLARHGFDMPSVLVLGGSRGAAAGALRLNYHVDDSAQNCIDVISGSSANPILIVPDADDTSLASARTLGIATAQSIGACLDILEQATLSQAQPGLLSRLAALVGWRS